MDGEFWLVIAGGLVGIGATVVPLFLQRYWARNDRRNAADAVALDAAVAKLMAWQDLAVRSLGSGDTEPAESRLRELDLRWESDFALIPDQAAVQEMFAMSRIFSSPGARHLPDRGARMDRLIELQGKVILSAQKKRRELA